MKFLKIKFNYTVTNYLIHIFSLNYIYFKEFTKLLIIKNMLLFLIYKKTICYLVFFEELFYEGANV